MKEIDWNEDFEEINTDDNKTLKCIKSLYKSTYENYAFVCDKNYIFDTNHIFYTNHYMCVDILDEKNNWFSFSVGDPAMPVMYDIRNYFVIEEL